MKVQIKYWLVIAITALLFACQTQEKQAVADEVKLEVFKDGNNWGYDIYINNKCFIHQYIIPAVPGRIHFKSKKEAELVGNLVADKIRNRELPKVKITELTLLGITSSI